ncbi:ribonuclease [Achlya hypogyna]|uniref:Ribonuclease n=1 Tax=Achlya hypogyna TaxID=1202772 RepID=A0A0A7CNF2_ACHHY|nr:secreted protein [Achlya hypogyna]OQR92682.1 ribonuclease [Achlya hypogyna]
MVRLIAVVLVASSVSAIDYLGGWVEPAHKQCVDICKNSNPKPGCFNPADDCHTKLQRPGDYDYMVFDQIYAPQFCRDLDNGVDSMITHQNVNKYPNGIKCEGVVKSELFVHGLWPNYNAGYPGCCNVTDTIPNKPFDASTFATKYPELFKDMSEQWIDPAVGNSTERLCQGYNHEFQKHGICFGAFGADYDRAAHQYFRATLDVKSRLDAASTKIALWATEAATNVTINDIQALYSKKVNVLCSVVPGELPNRIVAVRTCWAKAVPKDNCGEALLVAGETQDCAGALSTTCDAALPLDFSSYAPPAY